MNQVMQDTFANSDRMLSLKDDVMARGASEIPGVNPWVPLAALWRAGGPGRSRVQVRAAYLHELVGLAPLEIRPGWRLAGEHLPDPSGRDPARFGAAPPEELFAALSALGIAAEDVHQVLDFARGWLPPTEKRVSYAISESDPLNADGKGGWDDNPRSVYMASGWIENHSIRDFAKVLRLGFQGLRDEVVAQLSQADISAPDFPQQENFWRAALHICDAGILLGQRYANLAREMADRADSATDKARLEQMADVCAHVPARGARSFVEAVQSLWLCHILTCGEDSVNANSIGRLDQILFPWYAADIASGGLKRDEAVEIMEELACKLYRHYDVQAIILGGLDAQGRDAVNELSYVILDATENVGFARDLSVRLHAQSPVPFVDRVAELIVRGGGIPFIFNDDCFIPALTDRGIALKDARDYANIGCIELTIPGRANPHAVSGWFNAAKCLELTLFDGKDPRTGAQIGPPTGLLSDFVRFEDLYAAYSHQVDFFARRMVYHCNRGELAQREYGPLPCWSVMTDDCIERGRDITDGGALYNFHEVCFMGMANIADSLAAIRQFIYEDRSVAPSELLDALRNDYQGYENLRQRLLNRAPKYGNDAAEVDEIGQRICQDFIRLMDGFRSPLNGRYFVHLFTWKLNVLFGRWVGATPDGRKANEPLAYSLSAMQGRDEKGVTALLRSIARLPHNQAGGASAAIIEIEPSLVQGQEGVRRLSQIIRSAIGLGVGQMQWNVTTAEQLQLAKSDPEHYGNIIVRVAGYSQMFKFIEPEVQDHIIARTKHRQ